MTASSMLRSLLFLAFAFSLTCAFDYVIDEEESDLSFFLVDEKSGIENLQTLHNGYDVSVSVSGIAWVAAQNASSTTNITFTTFVDGQFVSSGTIDLSVSGKMLPSSFEVGTISVDSSGKHTITTELVLDGVTTVVENSYQSFTSASAIVPLVVVLFLAASTQIVELSLTFAIFVGACMVTGNVEDGFYRTLDQYILGALANEDHGFVFLFTFFLSGLVGMMQKSGGFGGFTNTVSRFATTSRAGQLTSYFSGLIIFFDDYANTLIVGESMRPLTDLLSVSREKLAFLVDATSAPVASITPISAWIGFELGLIQDEIDKITGSNDAETIRISTSALRVFLESVKYRYYPLFMLIFIPILIVCKRDYGPMLVAERKVQVYARQDGGDGSGSKEGLGEKANQPAADTPKRIWNMLIPLAILVILIIVLLVDSGTKPGEKQSFLDKMENANSYVALLYGSMSAALITLLFYHVQFKQEGTAVLLPTPAVLLVYFRGWFKKEDDEFPTIRPLLSIRESIESFLYGMGHVFPATIVLTLAWATGALMQAVGTDRFFADWISESIDYRSLPTLSFIISAFMALATGTSWGTMAIMFPLLIGPAYDTSEGNPLIVYATVAGILSGAVAGDHVSPISDTTVLTSLATDCELIRHVVTQAPYVLWICIFSILIGTLPVGYGSYPSGVAFLLGIILIAAFVFIMCRPVISKTGSFDPLTELVLRFRPNEDLHKLKSDTAEAYETMVLKYAGEKGSLDRSVMTTGMMSSFFFFKKNQQSNALAAKEVDGEEEKALPNEGDADDGELDDENEGLIAEGTDDLIAENKEPLARRSSEIEA